MPKVWLVLVGLLACGCAGQSASVASIPRFAGTWEGTWTNVADSTDAGTSTWTVNGDGTVDGHDFDAGRSTTFHVVGSISGTGALSSVSTPLTGAAATLNGPLSLSDNNHLSGVLVWGVSPPLSYQYSFTRK